MISKHSLISIIIPIYNVEKYLSKCLDSVLAQTYTNLQIILIDDGSTDNSGKICDEYALKDHRFLVIHKKNGGVCSARNRGLEVATGDYIGFVDPDDTIEPMMYTDLLQCLIQNQCDIAIGRQVDLLPNEKRKLANFPHQEKFLYTNSVLWFKDLVSYGANQVIWNKLYKRQVIGKIRFDVQLSRAEDLNFLLDLLPSTKKVIFVPQICYHYIIRRNSAVRSKQIRHFNSEYIVWKRILTEAVKLQENLIAKDIISDEWIQRVESQFVAQRAFKLALLIILLDRTAQYQQQLEKLIHYFSCLSKSSTLVSCTKIVRVWTWCLGNYPHLTIKLLRLPIIRQTGCYYVFHR